MPVEIAVSALQKECRRADEQAAVYRALSIYLVSPGYCWRRLLVIAAEDIPFPNSHRGR